MTGGRSALIRADASVEIGTGHVVRCLALGAVLLDRGWTVRLATRDLHPGLRATAEKAGVELVDLPHAIAIPDEPGWLRANLPDGVDVVVIDHYGIDAPWHDATSGWAATRVAIGDLVDRPQAVDLLVNPNLDATTERYATLTTASLLLGPTYALLDRSFVTARAAWRRRERLDRVLVFISGTDPRDVTGLAARGAATLGVPVDVVVGAPYPHRARLEGWAATRSGIEVHVATPRMAELMSRADVSIGAPGSASWERCCVGLPTVLITVADNQLGNEAGLVAAGAAIRLGRDEDVTEAAIAGTLAGLAADPMRLGAMSVAAAALTDGDGARRVADAIETLVAAPQA